MLSLTLGAGTFRVAQVKLVVPGVATPVGIRLDTSDVVVFQQVFGQRQYDLAIPRTPRLIVDAGANVGYASLWFASRYPGAKIVAIEPDAENFRLLTENTQDYPTIQRLSAGLWHRDGQLETVTHGADGGFLGHWGIQVREAQAAAGTRIPAVTLERILRESREDALDVLKLDVEGAEKEIFSENYEAWLSRTNVVIVELHDRFKPGCREAVFAALGTGDFEHQKQGEFDIFTRKSFR